MNEKILKKIITTIQHEIIKKEKGNYKRRKKSPQKKD